jgi:hypothetical protein
MRDFHIFGGCSLIALQAAKRAMACLEGVEDVSQISPLSRFVAGGVGGVVSQYVFPSFRSFFVN